MQTLPGIIFQESDVILTEIKEKIFMFLPRIIFKKLGIFHKPKFSNP